LLKAEDKSTFSMERLSTDKISEPVRGITLIKKIWDWWSKKKAGWRKFECWWRGGNQRWVRKLRMKKKAAGSEERPKRQG
jgi:hypothetical protein